MIRQPARAGGIPFTPTTDIKARQDIHPVSTPWESWKKDANQNPSVDHTTLPAFSIRSIAAGMRVCVWGEGGRGVQADLIDLIDLIDM